LSIGNGNVDVEEEEEKNWRDEETPSRDAPHEEVGVPSYYENREIKI
jgi:hypothetical protein